MLLIPSSRRFSISPTSIGIPQIGRRNPSHAVSTKGPGEDCFGGRKRSCGNLIHKSPGLVIACENLCCNKKDPAVSSTFTKLTRNMETADSTIASGDGASEP